MFSGTFSNIGSALPLACSFSRSLLYSPPNYRACSQSVAFDATAQQAFEVNLVSGKRQMSDSSWEIVKTENKQMKTAQKILMGKTGVNLLISVYSSYNEQ